MPKNVIWQTVAVWHRRTDPDKPAQPEAPSLDKSAQPDTAASPDKPIQPKPRLRRLLSKPVVTLAAAFGTTAAATLGALVVTGTWGFFTRSDTAVPGVTSASRSQPVSGAAALPFAVDASEDFEGCNAFALPAVLGQGRSYAQLTDSAAPTYAAWGAFLDGVSGAPVSQVGIGLTFSSAGGSSVRITDIEVKQARPPGAAYSGAYIPVPHQGGGDNPYNFTVDLDRPNATLQGGAGQEDFPGFEINVSANLDSTVFVRFTGMEHSYAWDFVVDYDEDGTAKTLQVDAPGGGPFTLTGPSASYGQVFAATGQSYVLTTHSRPSGQ